MQRFVICMMLGTSSAFANAFTDVASSVLPVAQGLMQNQQAAQAAEQQNTQAQAQLQLQQNQASAAMTQAQSVEMANMAAMEKKGYPILDPFARGTYWAMRDTQFKTSMAINAKRSELETKASKEAIDREFQATQQMITAVGGLMKTAGEQVQKLGEANAKKGVLSDKSVQCEPGGKNCRRVTDRPAGGCVAPAVESAGKCATPVSAEEQTALTQHHASTAPDTSLQAPPNCQNVSGQIHRFTCTGSNTEMSRAEATAFSTRRTQVQDNLNDEISRIDARLRSLPADHSSRSGLEEYLNNLNSAKSSFDTKDLREVEQLVRSARIFREESSNVAAGVAAGTRPPQ